MSQASQRNITIFTGKSGMEKVHLTMKKQTYYEDAQFSLSRGKITISEWMRLREMIDSPGDDNLVIVESILEFRENDKTI